MVIIIKGIKNLKRLGRRTTFSEKAGPGCDKRYHSFDGGHLGSCNVRCCGHKLG
jgi:hypothetical protein